MRSLPSLALNARWLNQFAKSWLRGSLLSCVYSVTCTHARGVPLRAVLKQDSCNTAMTSLNARRSRALPHEVLEFIE
jgi:hypothetical protein